MEKPLLRMVLSPIMFTASGVMILSLLSYFEKLKLGSREIIQTLRIGPFKRMRRINLMEVVGVSQGFFGIIKIKSKKGAVVYIGPEFAQSFMKALEYNKKSFSATEMFEIISENLNRKIMRLGSQNRRLGELGGKKKAFWQGRRILMLLSTVFFAIFIEGTEAYYLRQKVQNTEHLQDLRFEEIKYAFRFYEGALFDQLSEKWGGKCERKSDFHCRLRAYLHYIRGEKHEFAEAIKVSCHINDPHSCYNILIFSFFNDEEKDRAENILSNYCSTVNVKDPDCSTYLARLDKERGLARTKNR